MDRLSDNLLWLEVILSSNLGASSMSSKSEALLSLDSANLFWSFSLSSSLIFLMGDSSTFPASELLNGAPIILVIISSLYKNIIIILYIRKKII